MTPPEQLMADTGVPPFDAAYAAIHARDTRFDGRFFTAVLSTGIYCRPSCPAPTPKPGNVRFVRTAAEAQSLGLRPCLRCFPEALPDTVGGLGGVHDAGLGGAPSAAPDAVGAFRDAGTPRAELAARALAAIADGALDTEGVDALAASLHTSPSTLHRALVSATGVGAVAHARAHRARTAFRLLASTQLPATDVAFAAGFRSVRRFNETVQEVFGRTPGQLRAAAARSPYATAAGAPAVLSTRLPARGPVDLAGLLGFFAPRTLPGVDAVDEGTYRVALRLPHGPAQLTVRGEGELPSTGHLRARFVLSDAADLTSAVAAARRLFDLDADLPGIETALGGVPWLRGAVAARPGVRIPGEPSLTESLLRAVATQQVSVASGRAQLVRLVQAVHGAPEESTLPDPAPGATDAPRTPRGVGHRHTPPDAPLRPFPTAAQALETLPTWFRGPAARRDTLHAVLTLMADAERSGAAEQDPRGTLQRVGELKGIGPWTLAYASLRVLGSPDVDLTGDGALLNRAKALGLATTRRELAELLETARPWRSYAALHLWDTPFPATGRPSTRSTS